MSRRPIPAETRALQAKASDPSVSAWVSANAGSGKTHVLAQRVVRLLLGGVPPARILCLTFTKAAAANMSMRVFDMLAKWTTLDDEALTRAIETTGAPTPDAAGLVAARQLFARTVETPGGLKIQTIHAFCEKLLHLFPFEANVAARFEVIEDLHRIELLAEARRSVLERAIADEDGPLGRALRRFAAETSGSTFDELIDEALQKQDAMSRSIVLGQDTPGGYEAFLAAHFDLSRDDSVASIDRAILEDGLPATEWPGIAAAVARGGANDIKLARLLEAAAVAADPVVRLALYESVFVKKSDGEPKGLGAQKIVSKGLQAKEPTLLALLEAERDRICALRERRKAAALVERTCALMTVVGEILEAYRDEKQAQGLLDFGDLITCTAALLDRSNAAWVLHKLDRGIDHILVDEAQDTSPDQWKILRKISEDFTAGAGQRSTRRTFFAVGDEKQSIYSFQGARPDAFDEMRRLYEARMAQARQAFEYVELKRSFRSSGELLRLIDLVFSIEPHFTGLSSTAEKTVHEAWKEQLPAVVELWPVVERGDVVQPRDWELPLDVMEERDPPMLVARRIAMEIAAWLAPDSRESVEDEEGGRRRVAPGDVMILVRSRGPFFEAVIRALKEARVPVAGADRLELAQHIAVMDLVAAGRAALLPEDDLNLATVLKSPLIGLDDDDLLDIAPARKGSLMAALGASSKAAHVVASQRLARWREAAARKTPFFFFAHLLGAEGGRRDMLARLGPEAGDAVDEFLRLALEHETSSAPSLVAFLSALEGADLSIKRDMEAGGGAVRVMTVHASKGLEAKVVFLADTCGLPSTRHDPKLFEMGGANQGTFLAWSRSSKTEPKAVAEKRAHERELAQNEYRRLLYVAMTRAEERLYVAGFRGVQRPKGLSWYDMIAAMLGDELQPVPARWDATETIRRRRSENMPSLEALDRVEPAPEEIPLPGWLVTPAAPEAVPERPLSPSTALALADRVEPAPREGAAARGDAARAGRLVHALLQHLPEIDPAQRVSAAARFLSARASQFAPDHRDDLARQALAVLDDPALADLFGPESRAEVGLGGRVLLPGGREVEISGQIDRLAATDREILIADFKTGRARDAAETPPGYLAQLALYRAAVAPLYPGRRTRVFLVWTEGPRIVEIPEESLDAALAAVPGAGRESPAAP